MSSARNTALFGAALVAAAAAVAVDHVNHPYVAPAKTAAPAAEAAAAPCAAGAAPCAAGTPQPAPASGKMPPPPPPAPAPGK